MHSFAQGSRDLEVMSRLLDRGPETPWIGVAAEEVGKLGEPDYKGFEVLQGSVIIDLRRWTPAADGAVGPHSRAVFYRRFRVVKQADNTGNNLFRFRALGRDAKMEFRFPRQQLQPKVCKSCATENSPSAEKECQWEVIYDFQQVLPGEPVDLLIEDLRSGGSVQNNEESTAISFPARTDMAEMTVWVLMPAGKEYRSFRILRKGQGKVEEVKVASEYLAEDSTILAFRLLSVKANCTYELQWYYK